jgi:hypothetical protein
MAPKPKKTAPTWSDVKGKLTEFDRAGLLGVVQDLYAISKDNQAFLHALVRDGVRSVAARLQMTRSPSPVARPTLTTFLDKRALAHKNIGGDRAYRRHRFACGIAPARATEPCGDSRHRGNPEPHNAGTGAGRLG